MLYTTTTSDDRTSSPSTMPPRPHDTTITLAHADAPTPGCSTLVPTPQRQHNARHESANTPLTDITAKHHPASTALKFRARCGGEGCAGTQTATRRRADAEEGRRGHGGEGGERDEGDKGERTWKEGDEGDVPTVCAWWKGYGAPHQRMDGQRALAHVYATQLKPTRPLEEGRRVSLIALPVTKKPAPIATIEHYEPYDPHIHGEVIRIIDLGAGWARATIINECSGNRVGVIDLDLPYIPEITVREIQSWARSRVPAWCGESPEGSRDWKEAGGGVRCRGSSCGLRKDEDNGEGSFRAIPQQRKGRSAGRIPETINENGTFALHLWLKYEDYD